MTTAVPVPAIGPVASTGFWLHRAALAYLRQLDAQLRGVGLTHTQFQVLTATSWLGRGGAPAPTQGQIATFAGVDRMLTSKVLNGLEVRDLVERRADPADARSKRITPTAAGQDLIRRATKIARGLDADLFGAGTDLRDTLAALVRNDPTRE